jgi:hypothetical protein
LRSPLFVATAASPRNSTPSPRSRKNAR